MPKPPENSSTSCAQCGAPIVDHSFAFCSTCGVEISPETTINVPHRYPRDEMRVVITDVKMPFSSMVIFMVKWAFAAIPAFIIIYLLVMIVIGMGVSLFTHK